MAGRRHLILAFWAGLAVSAAGCGSTDLTGSRDPIEVEAGFRTDATSYRQGSGMDGPAVAIGILMENRSGTPLVPVPCTDDGPEWTLERLNGESWAAVATSSCLLAQWALDPVEPGTDYHGVVRLLAPVEPGTYRLVFGVLEVTVDGTRPVIDGRALSNTFQLTD